MLPEIRPHRAFIAVALLPLIEPLCARVAFGEGSPFWGRLAAAWLGFAPGLQLLAVALALFALAVVVKGLLGERNSKMRFWIGVGMAAFFSVVSVHVWYPSDARVAAQGRAENAVDSARSAIQRYAKHRRSLPPDLAALVPDYAPEIPNPRIAGSHLTYRRISGSDDRFELAVPCPGRSKPLAQYAEKESLLRRLFKR